MFSTLCETRDADALEQIIREMEHHQYASDFISTDAAVFSDIMADRAVDVLTAINSGIASPYAAACWTFAHGLYDIVAIGGQDRIRGGR